jgi:AMP-binding enzyme
VINVAGHRLGTKELESATIEVEEAEAAAVPVVDELRGRAVEIYVALKRGITPSRGIEQKVSQMIGREIGKIARPKNVWIVTDMPKTRSGKIMRRVIAGIAPFRSCRRGGARPDHRGATNRRRACLPDAGLRDRRTVALGPLAAVVGVPIWRGSAASARSRPEKAKEAKT